MCSSLVEGVCLLSSVACYGNKHIDTVKSLGLLLLRGPSATATSIPYMDCCESGSQINTT